MFFLNYLFALLLFIIIYLIERLLLFWFKKKAIWPLIDFNVSIRAIAYSGFSLILLGILHLVFKKINTINLLWLDTTIYLLILLIKPYEILKVIKSKEKKNPFQKKYALGGCLFILLMLECFAFNTKAYSSNKETYSYQTFINESISSDGEIKEKQIILKSKQIIYINTNRNDYDSIYLHFNNDDMNLYINIYELKEGADDYIFKKFVLINPTIDAYGYISLSEMSTVNRLKIEFDIDDSRYLNNSSKPNIIIDKISFDAYFPLIINPLRIGLFFGAIALVINFKSLFIDRKVKEDDPVINKIEKLVLFGGIIAVTYFFIQTLINNSLYYIKYEDLYLGGTSSNNIYYQQFDAYVKGQLHLDVPVDNRLNTISNPYNPAARNGITTLWDHAFYHGKYYCYYGHAPIYLVMLPVYWVTKYVPSNLLVLQLGTLTSIFTFVLAGLQIIKLFIKKINVPILIVAIIATVFGSLLLTNNTYEYGGMIYRIPYAYANTFLFLTIYLFLKGYHTEKMRFLYFAFAGLSLVLIVLSRPLEVIYLLLFVPLIIKMIRKGAADKKAILVDTIPALSVILVGAVIVCVMNYLRFGNILEFGEHYQLTVTDCTKNHLSIDGVLPSIYHYFIQAPKYNTANQVLSYSYSNEKFESHPYITCSIGLLFIPVALLMVLMPFIFNKDDDICFRLFVYISPAIIFFVAFLNYCFAGVCPRYLNDFAPWASLIGALVALKAIEKDDGKHPIVPLLITTALLISILLTSQYHFVEFDGLRIGDFNGLLGIIKTITNQYNY